MSTSQTLSKRPTGHYQVGLHHPLVNSFRNTLSAHPLLYADFQHFCVGHVAINTGSSLIYSCKKKEKKEKGINKMKILKLTKSLQMNMHTIARKKNIFLVEFSLSTEAAHNCCFWNKGQNISGCKWCCISIPTLLNSSVLVRQKKNTCVRLNK